MAIITTLPRGTADITPEASAKWQYIEDTLRKISDEAGVREIRTPTFEHTELFNRSVGDTTDVVQKEMYTFNDKGGRSITLRPEGTAGAVRAFIQNGLFNDALPVKLYYFTSCFRYEKPQAGRLREFHQYGLEFFGSANPNADAEVIAFAQRIFDTLGLSEYIKLELNSIGCAECRQKYNAALKEYFFAHKEELCGTCLDRLERNPMRIVDCKSPVCSNIAKDAPVITDYLCDDCREHFNEVCANLENMGIDYTVNPHIVRGLDYYNRTVFEFVTDKIGAQATVLGGGRYDPLTKYLGGPDVPALGFATGIERLMLLLTNVGLLADVKKADCKVYIASMDKETSRFAMKLVQKLRDSGVYAECDVCGRSLKAQMKYADKISAEYSAVLGADELAAGECRIKNMTNGDTKIVKLDNFTEFFTK